MFNSTMQGHQRRNQDHRAVLYTKKHNKEISVGYNINKHNQRIELKLAHKITWGLLL